MRRGEKSPYEMPFEKIFSRPLAPALFMALLLTFWGAALQHLTTLPLVHEDEPWLASTSAKLAADGIFASDLLAGYHRMEQRYYGYFPLHSVVTAALFRSAGSGLFQARWVSVACGAVILALTCALAKRLFHDARIGALAVAFLALGRGLVVSALHPTGILFLDVSQVARYDVLAPLFGLLAFHIIFKQTASTKIIWYFGAGFGVALASLAHPNGAFFLPVLFILIVWQHPPKMWQRLGALTLGFAAPWLGYAVYVLQDLDAWRGQTRVYGARLQLWNLSWYLENVRAEIQRYSLGWRSGAQLAWRPSFWFLLAGLSAAMVALAQHAFFRRERAAQFLLVPLVVLPILLALLVRLKFTNYLYLGAPFAALALAWLCIRVWDWLAERRAHALLRASLILLLGTVLLEGAIQIARREERALTITPYPQLIARLQENIPRAARVVGLPKYALGWDAYTYRSLSVPFLLANPQYEPAPLPLATALNRSQPEYILLDADMQDFINTLDKHTRAQFDAWLSERGARQVQELHDASYGTLRVYRLEK